MKHCIPILFLFLLCSCEYSQDFYISFLNNSDKPVYVDWSDRYPADSLHVITTMVWNPNGKIDSNSERQLTNGTEKYGSWLAILRKSYKGYLSVTIFDSDVISKDNRERALVKYDVGVLARYDLTEEDLDNLNWSLTYPPSPEMANVHMWIRD